jgi:hypothetical protein
MRTSKKEFPATSVSDTLTWPGDLLLVAQAHLAIHLHAHLVEVPSPLVEAAHPIHPAAGERLLKTAGRTGPP